MTPTIARIERGAYRTWSPDEIVEIGGWMVGSNRGFTRRANSANARGPVDTSIETGAAIRRWLVARNATMTVRITPLVPDDVAAAAARSWGLAAVDATPVLVRHRGDADADPDSADVRLVPPDDARFMDELVTFNGRPESARPIWSRLVERLDGPHTGIWIPGRAVGIVALTEAIGFVYSVAVSHDHRRQGLASRVMANAHAFAAEHDAEATSLQVFGTNAAALGLYARLGYEERYRYHYLQDASPDQA